MPRRMPWVRVLPLWVAVLLLAVACGGGATQTTTRLAADQTLRLPMLAGYSVASLDPAHVDGSGDIGISEQIFGGVLKFDQQHRVVPYAASAMPTISADGLTYTFHLRPDARFSNGDPLTSGDVLFSWNRTAAAQDAYAAIFQPVVGYQDVAAGHAKTLAGLTAPDPHTVVAKLQAPAGYWLDEIANWPAMLVDQRIVAGAGQSWWSNPATAIGIGPFRLMSYRPNVSLDFAPVAHWWGGSTGTLTHVHLDLGVEGSSAVKKYEVGGYDIVGELDQPPSASDILRYQSDPTKRSQLHLYQGAATIWMSYGFTGQSPFAAEPGLQPGQPTVGLGTDQGLPGRQAFSLAINRTELANVGCARGLTCSPATGGYIAPGLRGSLGAGQDPWAPASGDPSKAKAEYRKWDPDGSKVRNLRIEYNTSPQNDTIWQNVQAQLRQSLGVNLQLYPTDTQTWLSDLSSHQVALGRNDWSTSYDDPQDWFTNNFECANNWTGYCDPAMDKIVEAANQKPVDQVVNQYQKAGRMLVQNQYAAELYYPKEPYLIQPYVKGAGSNGLQDYPWTQIRILAH